MATGLLEEVETIDEPPGLRERQRVARGGAILEAAFALMVEQGYDALTMEAVAARVGISRQTLYHHFKSRDEIVLRALLSLTDESVAMIGSLDSLPPMERLEKIVRWMIESKAEPARAALVKVKQSLAAVLSHPDCLAAFERRARMLAEIVEAAQSGGDMRGDLEPRLVVRMLLNLVSAACVEGASPEISSAMADVFFAGLRA